MAQLAAQANPRQARRSPRRSERRPCRSGSSAPSACDKSNGVSSGMIDRSTDRGGSLDAPRQHPTDIAAIAGCRGPGELPGDHHFSHHRSARQVAGTHRIHRPRARTAGPRGSPTPLATGPAACRRRRRCRRPMSCSRPRRLDVAARVERDPACSSSRRARARESPWPAAPGRPSARIRSPRPRHPHATVRALPPLDTNAHQLRSCRCWPHSAARTGTEKSRSQPSSC